MRAFLSILTPFALAVILSGCGGQDGQRVEVDPAETAAYDAEVEAAERAQMGDQNRPR